MQKTLDLEINLHTNQFKVRQDPARFKVLVAGRRFGKTTLAIDELILAALKSEHPCWYVAPTYKQAKMIAWEMLLKKLPPQIIRSKNEVELTVEMITGAPICLKGADNEDSLRGAGLGFVVLDEYGMMKNNVWEEIIRPMLTDTKGKALFIGTPQGKNKLWQLYVKGQRKEDGYSSYLFKTVDNPFIDPLEVEDAKKQLNERYFKQEYEASFEDYTGLIWPEFNHSIHVIQPHYVDKMFPRVGAIDPAISGTTAALKAYIDEDGVITIYEEYYDQNRRVSEVVPSIKDDAVRWLIDPASAAKNIQREGKLYSLYDEYFDHGIHADPAENDVDAGINRVAEYFKSKKIRIFSACKNLISELERYHWSEERETISGIMKPKPYKNFDHACDALRYIVMSRVRGAQVNLDVKVHKHSVAYEMEKQDRLENDWRRKYGA